MYYPGFTLLSIGNLCSYLLTYVMAVTGSVPDLLLRRFGRGEEALLPRFPGWLGTGYTGHTV